MFKGYINNKEYDNQAEFYKDLAEIQKKGEPFTANSTYSSSSCEKTNTCPSEVKNEKLDNFETLKDNLISFDDLYKRYNEASNKEVFMKQVAQATPRTFTCEELDSIKNLTYPHAQKLFDLVESNIEEYNYSREETNKRLSNVKERYEELDKKRTQYYNALKALNDEISDLAETRNLYMHWNDMLNYIASVNDAYYNALDRFYETKSNELENSNGKPYFNDKKEVKETNISNKPGETITMDDIIDSFRSLYNKFLA